MAALTYAPSVVWDAEVHAYLQRAFGEAAFLRISKPLCTPPLHTCLRVNTLKCSPQVVLESVLSDLSRGAGDDKPDQSKQGNSAKDYKESLEHEGQTSGRTANRGDNIEGDAETDDGSTGIIHKRGAQEESTVAPFIHPLVPCAVIVPGAGPFQPDYSVCGGKEVVISRLAGEAVLRGAELYCPGVIACSGHVIAGDLVAVSIALELPGSQWCGITRGTTLESAHSQQSPAVDRTRLCIGIGRAMMSRTQIFRESKGLAVRMERRVFAVSFDPDRFRGVAIMQNLPSIVAAQVLGVKPGMRVLDMCAAPGGKTTMLAQLMENKGCIIALDRTQAKVVEIMTLAEELGLQQIYAYKMDATKAVARTKRARAAESQIGGAPKIAAQIDGSKAKGILTATAAVAATAAAATAATTAATATAAKTTAAKTTAATIAATTAAAAAAAATAAAARAATAGATTAATLPVPTTTPAATTMAVEPAEAAGTTATQTVPASGTVASEQIEAPPGVQQSAGPQPAAKVQSGILPPTAAASIAQVPADAAEFMVFEETSGSQSQEGNEKVLRRLQRKQEAARRHSANCKTSPAVCATPSAPPRPNTSGGAKLVGFLPESFDAIMLDAPCTALGLRPRLLQANNLKLLQQTARYQRQLLDAAVQLLRPRGHLVFSTCSISPGENEANVRYVLDTYPCMQLVQQSPRVGGPGLVGSLMSKDAVSLENEVAVHEAWLCPEEAELVQRFDPSAETDTIGFFVARFCKLDEL